MEKRVGKFRIVVEKPRSAVCWWVFLERITWPGETSWRLFLSSAFTGWGWKFVSSDGAVAAPLGIRKHF